MKKLLFFLSFWAPLLWFGPAAAAPPAPEMFAFGMEIDTAGDDGFYELTLPLAVYQGVTRKDLGDVRVFNRHGQVVPHALRRPQAAARPARTSTRLMPFFPVSGGAGQQSGDLTLHVQRDSQGTIIDVRAADPPDAGAEKRTIAFLIDAGADPPPIDGLTLAWPDTGVDFLGRITVEASSDLTAWHPLATATVARLAFQGRRLEQSSIPFARHSPRYLRLTWPAEQPVLALSAVAALIQENGGAIEPARQWVTAQGFAAADTPGRFSYDLPGFMPVDRVRIRPAAGNFLADARLLAADAPTASLQEQWQGLVYHIRMDGQTLASLDITVRPESHRFWQLALAGDETAAGAAAPVMEFGWLPDQLIFLAQGPGPYQLAYGSATTAPAAFPLAELLGRASLAKGEPIVPRSIAAGAPHPLGGEEKLRPPRTLPWKKYLLWAALFAGVLMVGGMSVLLYRQLRAGKDGTGINT
jgi:hypothetical protein